MNPQTFREQPISSFSFLPHEKIAQLLGHCTVKNLSKNIICMLLAPNRQKKYKQPRL